MSATTIVIPPPPVFDEARLAVAGFLARYSGPTRVSYSGDLRQFFAWCAQVDLAVFAQAGPPRAVGPIHGGTRTGPGHHRPAAIHGGRLLPHLRARRAARALPGRARPPPEDRHRVGHPGPGPHGTRPPSSPRRAASGADGPRPGLPARAARPASGGGLLDQHRGPLRRAGTSHRHRAGQGIQTGRHPPAAPGGPGRRSGRRGASSGRFC